MIPTGKCKLPKFKINWITKAGKEESRTVIGEDMVDNMREILRNHGYEASVSLLKG